MKIAFNKIMKKHLIISMIIGGFIFCCPNSVTASVIKFRTTEYASIYLKENNTWAEWTEWEKANILITVDNNRVKVFSNKIQIFDIATDEGKTTNENEEVIYSFFCVNKDGIECRLKFMDRFYKDGSPYKQLYIIYSDFKFVYNIYSI